MKRVPHFVDEEESFANVLELFGVACGDGNEPSAQKVYDEAPFLDSVEPNS